MPTEWLQNDITDVGNQIFVLEAPKQCELVCKLIEAVKPELVVCSLTDYEIKGKIPLDALLRQRENLEQDLLLTLVMAVN